MSYVIVPHSVALSKALSRLTPSDTPIVLFIVSHRSNWPLEMPLLAKILPISAVQAGCTEYSAAVFRFSISARCTATQSPRTLGSYPPSSTLTIFPPA